MKLNDKEFDDKIKELYKTNTTDHLSEEFKDNLVNMMNKEYTKKDQETSSSKAWGKIKSSFENREKISVTKKLVIVFSCIILISTAVIGVNFNSWVEKIFSNQDKRIEMAIQNGDYHNIEMDYIVHNSVGIKVDYVYADDSCIYIAFNVKSDKKIEKVYFENIELIDQNNENINNKLDYFFSENETKRINSSNCICLYKFHYVNNNNNIDNILELNINVSKVIIISDKTKTEISDTFNYSVPFIKEVAR